MKKIIMPILIALCINIVGCSTTNVATYRQLYSVTKEVQRKKVALGSTKKIVFFSDFRGNEIYDEDVLELKDRIEKYIALHPDLSDALKEGLRALKVSEGLDKAEAGLLLGRPDKIIKIKDKTRPNATEAWVYKTNKVRAFTVFIIPVFFVPEEYFLYFNENVLAGIERHSLKQIVRQGPGEGVAGSNKKLDPKQ